MKTLGEQIREKALAQKELLDKAEALINKAGGENRDFTEDEQKEYDGYMAGASLLRKAVDRLAALKDERAANARFVRSPTLDPDDPDDIERTGDELDREERDFYGDTGEDDDAGPFQRDASGGSRERQRRERVRERSHDPRASRNAPMLRELEKGESLGQLVRAIAATKGNPMLAWRFAKANKMHPHVIKALQSNAAGAGQEWVGTQMAGEFIDLLMPAQVVRSANPRFMQFEAGTGKIVIPRLASSGSADYVGEAQPIPYTQIGTADMELTPFKLGALTALTREVMRRTTPSIDREVRDNLVEVTALRADAQMLRGVASSIRPAGIRHLADPSNIVAATTPVTLDSIIDDLDSLELFLTMSLIPKTRLVYFISPRVEKALKGLRNEQGTWAFREEMGRGTINNIRYKATTQMPDDLGVGSNESEIILVDMAQIIVADEIDVTVQVSDEAAFIDGSGQMRSAFSNDMTVIKVVTSHDIDTRYPEAIAVLTGVTWGQ